MSLQEIESAINTAKQITQWSSLLIEYNHKRNPNEYVCYNINFASAQLLNDIITSMCDAFLNVVKKTKPNFGIYSSKSQEHNRKT